MTLVILGLAGAAWAFDTPPWSDGTAEWWLAWHEGGSLDPEVQQAVQQAAFDNLLEQVECVPSVGTWMGSTDDWEQGPRYDYRITVYFDDPTGMVPDGVLAMTWVSGINSSFEGEPTSLWADADVVYAAGVDWASTEEVEAGSCTDAYAIEAVATQELAHLYGYDGAERVVWDDLPLPLELMTGPEDIQPCDLSATTLPDDVLQWVEYRGTPFAGPSGFYEDAVGAVPFEKCFSATVTSGDREGLIVEWSFGDGTTSTELDPCHTWTDEGQYTLLFQWAFEGADCDGVGFTWQDRAGVTAGSTPHPATGFDTLFAVEDLGEGTWQLVNQADLSVPGCVDTVEWTILQEGEVVKTSTAWSPKVVVEPGPIEVRLRVAGVGGEASARLEAAPAGGCSTAPAGGLLGLLVGLLAAGRRPDQNASGPTSKA